MPARQQGDNPNGEHFRKTRGMVFFIIPIKRIDLYMILVDILGNSGRGQPRE